jgi:hypothetical protein
MKMGRKSFYPSRTTRDRDIRLKSRWINRRGRGIGVNRRNVVWRACHSCIKISSVREQIKQDISEDRRRTRGTRRKGLHTTKKPIFPKGDMLQDAEPFGNRIIITISFMFNAIPKETT